MVSKIQIRHYEMCDLDNVIELFQRSVREVASRDYSPAQVSAWSTVDRNAWKTHRLSRPTWVAVDGENIAGFTDLEADGHLDMMFVHPDYQGFGVASLLLERVEAAAIQQGLIRIFTEASRTARPFFERRGFVVDAEQVVQKRGERMINYRMHKLL